jgi:Uma2 family endonuclease
MVAVKDFARRFTPEEYFAWEEQQSERHELIAGYVYAMSGGTINHSEIAARFNRLLGNHLDDSGCRVLNSDARISILETTDYSYPDGSVTCDERDKTTIQYITYPCLIVEVLSDSTVRAASVFAEAYDRSDKFYRYRRNPILQEYVLVSAKSIAIDLYRKNDAGEWLIAQYRAGDTIELRSIDLSFPLAEPLRMRIEQVYRGIVFE